LFHKTGNDSDHKSLQTTIMHTHKKRRVEPSEVKDTHNPVSNTINGSDDVDVDVDVDPSVVPGRGWSNGDMRPEMFPLTRNGKLQLYSSQRRWLHLSHGWSRIGEDSDEFSRRVSCSAKGQTVVKDLEDEARAVRSLIAQLCEQFYRNGWATGTGGGISIRVGGPDEQRPFRVFVAPSGIQKEDMIGDDVFELDMDRTVIHAPKTPNLRQSACTPLWYVVYKNRPNARAVIHTHSMHAQMATLLDPTETSPVLRITHLEMLKGVGHHGYDDVLEVPIIDNRPTEDLLADQLETAIKEYPNSNCVLVRRHGLYVWGDSWEQAKTQCEAFDYLFESCIKMRQMGVDFSKLPPHGTYRIDDEADSAFTPPSHMETLKGSDCAAVVTPKPTPVDGFHGLARADNHDDLVSNKVPILPRDSKVLLLDIEGCTTSISFVKDTLFPYVLKHVEEYTKSLSSSEYEALATALSDDLNSHEPAQELLACLQKFDKLDSLIKDCHAMVKLMVEQDYKLPSLKSMQGKIWKRGYETGTLKGHVYSDFVPMLQWMENHGVHVCIYSSGSVQAQKLLFGNSIQGDLCDYLHRHFDITTSGNKKEARSYANIFEDLQRYEPMAGLVSSASDIVFVSDAEAECEAALQAGMKTVMSIRPGNATLTEHGKQAYPAIYSLLQLCGL
jgi:methylthioribulose 1-phosphate dehydratase / enolase-phosphatase E1